MGIEEDLFQKVTIDPERLLAYGFKRVKEEYVYSKEIMDHTFRIDLFLTPNGKIRSKIYDLTTLEEYTNYRVEQQTGAFVSSVRLELEQLLKEIREKCATRKWFMSSQANRIADLIQETYHDGPEFVWDQYPDYGVFRNPITKKWYGLIMLLERSKFEQGTGQVEVLNVKLKKENVVALLGKKGCYPAYHMNKKHWISLVLDDTLRDLEIMAYVKESHAFTEKK